MPRATVSPETKAAALAALLAGEQPAIVAERYQIPPPTVRRWKQEALSEVQQVIDRSDDRSGSHDRSPGALQARPGVEMRKRRIAELVLDLLAAKLEASQRLTQHLSDPAYLGRQKFEQLVELNGYLDRSALTLGDRLAGAESDDAGDDEPA